MMFGLPDEGVSFGLHGGEEGGEDKLGLTFGIPRLVGAEEDEYQGEDEEKQQQESTEGPNQAKRKRSRRKDRAGKDKEDGEGKRIKRRKNRRREGRRIPESEVLPEVVPWGLPTLELWDDKQLIVDTLSNQAQEGDVQTPVIFFFCCYGILLLISNR